MDKKTVTISIAVPQVVFDTAEQASKRYGLSTEQMLSIMISSMVDEQIKAQMSLLLGNQATEENPIDQFVKDFRGRLKLDSLSSMAKEVEEKMKGLNGVLEKMNVTKGAPNKDSENDKKSNS